MNWSDLHAQLHHMFHEEQNEICRLQADLRRAVERRK